MPRPARKDIICPGGTYRIYAQGHDGAVVFRDAEDFEFYTKLMIELCTEFAVHIYHFALTPNQVDVLLSPDDESTSEFMKRLQNLYSKRFCKRHGLRGHIWRGRFKSEAITSNAYLFACGNDIETNPVYAGLVSDPGLWPYSSYRHYAFGEPKGPVETDPFYIKLGRTVEERRVAYRKISTPTRSSA